MSSIIQQIKNTTGDSVYPVTKTSATYDDNGNRLDNTLTSINDSLNNKQDSLKTMDVQLNLADYTFSAKGSMYYATKAISTIIGSYTKVLSLNIVKWSGLQAMTNVIMDGDGTNLNILMGSNTYASGAYIKVRFVYV